MGAARRQDASRMFGLFKYSQKERKQCETHSEGENRIPAVNQTFAVISSAFFVLTECKLSSADLTPATFAADFKVRVVFLEAKMKQ